MIFSPERPGLAYVVEQYTGLLRAVQGGSIQATPVLDLHDRINSDANETGFLGLALHPDVASNKRIFVYYTVKGQKKNRIVEYRMATPSGVIDPSSGQTILEIVEPYSNHQGGNLVFGPDGYLYIGVGDGGSANDPQGNGQNLKTLLAKMLRIDVNHGAPYTIPADNPVFSDPQAKREIYAYGMRNPWRFSFDRLTGQLWVGDVGQDALEEIDVLEKGKNYGWNTMEGKQCFRGAACNRTGLTLPVWDYPRSEGASITGGYVYRGSSLPALIGSYVYGDYVSGRISALRQQDDGSYANKLLADAGINVSSFGEDLAGELYVLDHTRGEISKIGAASLQTEALPFPRKLSETGCFSSLDPLTPAAGVEAYDVKAPLWSDGAAKTRFIRVPPAQSIAFKPTGAFTFPEGTVLVKNFYAKDRLIETRFMVRRASGFKGYTYRWDDTETDATLLGGAASGAITVDGANGDPVTFDWYYPSGADCTRCHVPGSGGALGVDSPHLDASVVRHLAARGIISPQSLPPDLDRLPRLASVTDQSATMETKARSYLHAQCSQCHNRDFGTGQGRYDFRFTMTLADMRVCNVAPTSGDLGVPGAKLLVPGVPEKSLIYLRARSLDKATRMPPLGTSRRDEDGLTVLAQWIRGLGACP